MSNEPTIQVSSVQEDLISTDSIKTIITPTVPRDRVNNIVILPAADMDDS